MISNFESFETNLPEGFALLDFRATGTNAIPSATYNSAQKAVDLSQSGNSHGQWRFQNKEDPRYWFYGASDFDVSVDLEVTGGSTDERHVGFHLWSNNGEECWQVGNYRNPSTGVSGVGITYGKVDGTWNTGGESIGVTQGTATPLNLNTRYILRIVRAAGSDEIKLYINDVVSITYTNILSSTALRVCLFLYNTNVRVHSVSFNATVAGGILEQMTNDVNSFDTSEGMAVGAVVSYNNATTSRTYNSSLKAVDYSSADSSCWYFSNYAASLGSPNLWVEIDIELLSDPTNRRHFGVFLINPAYSVPYGLRFSHLDSGWTFSKFAGSWPSEVDLPSFKGVINNPTINLNTRYRFRVMKIGGGHRVYINDRLVYTANDSTFTDLIPAIFTWANTIRVHSVTLVSVNKTYTAPDASFSNLNSLILAKNPLLYLDVAATQSQSLPNKGSLGVAAKWYGGIPGIISSAFGDFARIGGGPYLTLSSSDTVVDISNGYTIEFLGSIDALRTNARILSLGNLTSNTVGDMLEFFTTTSGFRIYRWTNNVQTNSGFMLNPPLDSIIHLVLVVKSDKTMQLYLNGGLWVTGTFSTTWINTITVNLGNLFYSEWDLKGFGSSDQTLISYVKYVCFYNFGFTARQVFDHAAQITVLGSSGLLLSSTMGKSIKAKGLSVGNSELVSKYWPGENRHVKFPCSANKRFYVKDAINLIRPPLRSEVGYISGIITRKGSPASGQRVACFDSRFNLLAETISGSDGSYRFDGLSKERSYLVVAKDNDDYKYNPAAIDMKTPEAYP